MADSFDNGDFIDGNFQHFNIYYLIHYFSCIDIDEGISNKAALGFEPNLV